MNDVRPILLSEHCYRQVLFLEIEKLARKIRVRKNAEPSDTIRSQRARPTWASSSNTNSHRKRKYDTEDAEDANSSKRGKVANNV